MPRELRLELPRHIATRPRRRRSNRPIAPAAGVESPRLSHKGPSTNWGRRPVGGGGRSCPGRVVAAAIAHRSHRMWPAGRLSSHGRETGGTGRDKSPKIRGAAGDAVHLGTHVWCGEPGRPCPHPRTCCLRLAAQRPTRRLRSALCTRESVDVAGIGSHSFGLAALRAGASAACVAGGPAGSATSARFENW